MRYSIGDVARTLGVTPAGLHYFEREGVIAPVKGDASSRSYSTVEFIRLVSYKKYRNMEMPLKGIAQQFSAEGDDYPSIQQKVAAQVRDAETAAAKYQALARDTAWFRDHIQMGIERLGKYDVASMPECYVLRVGNIGCISKEKSEQMLVAKWLENMPAVRISVFLKEDGRSQFGYSIHTDRAAEIGLDQAPAFRMGGKPCFHTFVRIPKGMYENPAAVFADARKYLTAHGFEQDGEAAAVVLCVYCHGEELDSLMELYMPFK